MTGSHAVQHDDGSPGFQREHFSLPELAWLRPLEFPLRHEGTSNLLVLVKAVALRPYDRPHTDDEGDE